MALLDEQIDGKYEILQKIREGGMGAIYKVRHRLLDEIRVVKVIRSQAEPSSEASDRFLSEARAAIRLRHPNIAVLHDFAVSGDGQAFIVMEFIEGWNLQEMMIGYGTAPLNLTLEIARQSLKALGYLHRHRIVHRDVSPDNLMVTRDVDGHLLVKLIDLGIAKTLEGAGGLTTTGVFLGKPRYGSPERFTGEGWDQRSDLYSFGVVLYELLTGRCPFAGNEPAALMAGHLFRAPLDFAETDSSGRVPEPLRELVLHALAKKPDERIPTAEAFLAALAKEQARYPFDGADLETLWTVLEPIDARFGTRSNPGGSTQFRLDREFGAEITPTFGVPAPKPGSPLLGTISASEVDVAGGPRTTRTVEPPQVEATQPLPIPSAPGPQPEDAGSGPGPLMLRGESVTAVDLDATWSRRPLRKEPELKKPGAAPSSGASSAPPSPGASAPRTPSTTRTTRPAQAHAPNAPSSPSLQAFAAVERRRTPWVWIGAGLLAVVAAGGGWWWGRIRPSQGAGGGRPAVEQAPLTAPSGGAMATSAIATSDIAPLASEVPATEAPPEPKSPSPVASSSGSSTPALAPAVRPAAPTARRSATAPKESMGPVFVPPMKLGDLISPRQPGVEGPEVKSLGNAVYPAEARGSGQSLTVQVRVLVDETGRVAEARVVGPDASALGFDRSALEAARQTTFFPATREGVAGKMWTEVAFELNDPAGARRP